MFVLLALETLEHEGVSTGPLLPVVAVTVALSVVLHGFSARPLAAWYGRHVSRLADDAPEFVSDEEPPMMSSMTMHDDMLDT